MLFLLSTVVAKLENDQNCNEDIDCLSGNCSIYNNRVCKPRKILGENCIMNTDCVSERCSGLNGGECMERLNEGIRCFLDEDCSEGLFCNWFDDQGTCSKILRVTERCMKDSECETSWCSYADLMTCQYKKDKGERCLDSHQCVTGYCGEGFQCSDRKELEAGCFRNTDCQSLNCEWSLNSPWVCGSEQSAMMSDLQNRQIQRDAFLQASEDVVIP